ncbi:MAG: glycosyltransferase family 1 protein [bacterium]|nr:glycosyltransferase family 1 protein [bacterium]
MKKIKVAFFGEDFSRKAKGTALVVQKLTEQLLANFSDQAEVVLIRKAGPCSHPLAEKIRNIEIKVYPSPIFSTLISYLIFFISNKESFDAVIFNKFVYPGFWFLNSKKFVLLAYDAPANLIYKEKLDLGTKLFYGFLGIAGKYFLDSVIAVSKDARQAVIEYHHLNPDRVSIIYPAAGENFKKYSEDAKEKSRKLLEDKYGIAKPFILDVSRIEPHKNIHTLIEAFSLLKSAHPIPHKLVIAGGRHLPKYTSMIEAQIKSRNLNQDVIIAPYIEDEDMPAIYNLADVLAFPSLLEGFGLPIVEAMSCGTPVIVSDIPVLAEVAGGAAVLADPKDPQQWADKIFEVLSNNSLRGDLIIKGLERSKIFSWQDAANKFLQILKI